MRNNYYLTLLGTGVVMVGCFFTTARGYAQSLASLPPSIGRPVQEPEEREMVRTLSEVLKELEAKHGVFFTYKSNALENKYVRSSQVASYGASQQYLAQVLREVLSPYDLRFEKIDNIYFIIPKEENVKNKALRKATNELQRTDQASADSAGFQALSAKSLHQFFAAQDIPVQGKITSEEGTALPGVSVSIKGTTTGTVADADGSYKLTAPSNAVLLFSFIGYQTQEVLIGNRTTVDVQMLPDVRSLSEVVVVGYGTQKKTSLTGAVSSVSAKDISALPVANVSQALQGRVAGVSVVNNGAPGASPIIRIRGIGTINNADPLFVIDGFPTGDLNSFDTKDIASVEVLKDAYAAAIYGSRAANGVILISTKKGSAKKLSVFFDSYAGVQRAWRTLDLLNRDQYLAYARDLESNAAIQAGNDPSTRIPERIQTGLNEPIYPGANQTYAQTETDWQKEMFRTAAIQQHRVELSGGNDVSHFFASAGFFKQEGIMLGTGYQRGNFRLNSEHRIGKRFTFGQTLGLAYDDRYVEQIPGGRTQVQLILRNPPYLPVRNPNNTGGFEGAKNLDGTDPENPVRIATMDRQNLQVLKVLGTVYVDTKIFDWLTYRFQTGIDLVYNTERTAFPSFNTGPGGFAARGSSFLSSSRYSFLSPIFTNQLTFNRSFGKHTVNAIVAAEKQSSVFSNIGGGGTLEYSNIIQQPVGVTNAYFYGSKTEWSLISYLGRLNYEYDNKYLLGVAFRRDGSSRFAPGRKLGTFPAISAGWRINEEAFLKNSTLISELKLRGSYGLTGNNNIGDYAYQPTLNFNQYYQFDRAGGTLTPGATVRRLANIELQWEQVKMTNVGLDLGLLRNQITFTAEYFNNLTEKMILNKPIALSLGYDQPPLANTGSVRNRGVELMLGYHKTTGDFRWDASANFTAIQNKVISLGDSGATFTAGSWAGDNLTLTEVGQPIAYFRGYLTDGLFQNQAEINASAQRTLDENGNTIVGKTRPGDIRFKDLNNDGVLNEKDKVKIGHFLPKFSYGFNFSAQWKNFDASLFIQGVHGNQIYSVVKYDLEGMTRLFNAGTAVLNRWTQEGQLTNVPRAISGDPNNNARASDRFIEEGSYLRIKNLTLGYALPKPLLQSFARGAISSVRIYASSQNLLTLTGYRSGYDPEVGTQFGSSLNTGIDYGQYPQPRSVMVGLQVGF